MKQHIMLMYKKYIIVIMSSSNFSHLHVKTQLEPLMPNEVKKHLIPIRSLGCVSGIESQDSQILAFQYDREFQPITQSSMLAMIHM